LYISVPQFRQRRLSHVPFPFEIIPTVLFQWRSPLITSWLVFFLMIRRATRLFPIPLPPQKPAPENRPPSSPPYPGPNILKDPSSPDACPLLISVHFSSRTLVSFPLTTPLVYFFPTILVSAASVFPVVSTHPFLSRICFMV